MYLKEISNGDPITNFLVVIDFLCLFNEKKEEDLSGISQITPSGLTTSTTPTSSFDLSKLKTPGVSSFSSVENPMGYNYPDLTSGFNLSSLKIPTR